MSEYYKTGAGTHHCCNSIEKIHWQCCWRQLVDICGISGDGKRESFLKKTPATKTSEWYDATHKEPVATETSVTRVCTGTGHTCAYASSDIQGTARHGQMRYHEHHEERAGEKQKGGRGRDIENEQRCGAQAMREDRAYTGDD